jgi:chromatin structure-remodeling complex protein RSC7
MLHDEEVMGGGKPFSIVQGKVYVIEGDEFVTEDDAKGDTKMDRNGNLLGGACVVSLLFVVLQTFLTARRT